MQILATNDFHGRILDNPGDASAGAASLAGAVKELRDENPDTVFAAAGDLIGASTFESFIANDKPTIDALNEAGLEVSAAGNHEFDQGYRDLVDRVMAPYDATTNPEGGANWQYIAANVRLKSDHSAALPETWFTVLPDGKRVGFVGAVTEDLPALVAGGGIAEIEVTDIVDAVNFSADQLKGPGGCAVLVGCDLVIELVHEGAATTAYSSVTDSSTFAHIVDGANENVDAIVSGHTHLAYNHKVPVQEWIDEDRAVTKRPVVSAGQYGAFLNRLEFEYTPGTDDLVNIRQTVVGLKDYDGDPATQAIVDQAVASAATLGDKQLGDLAGQFKRARRLDPVTSVAGENRGGESTLGNLVAEIQRWKTGSQIGFMNPGGLRADLLGTDGTPRVLTYRQAADAQPFANTLVTMDLTGAQIKGILEQQWQRDADGNIPSRPFLRLGTSTGFQSTFDATRAEGDRITGMWLDGTKIDPAASYQVSATSFLASGTGDNFWGFAGAAHKQDTGKTDLQAVVDYLEEFAKHDVDAPLPVDFSQHQTGVGFPAGAPSAYQSGDTLAFTVSSLAMTGLDDAQDSQVELRLGQELLGTFPVTNTLQSDPFDDAGKATVSATLPPGITDGRTVFTLRGVTTGTTVKVPVATSDGLPDTVVSGAGTTYTYGRAGSVEVTVTPGEATGTVSLRDGDTVLGTATLVDGKADVAIEAKALSVGTHDLTLVYSGDSGHSGNEGGVQVEVVRALPVVANSLSPQRILVGSGTTTATVSVSAVGYQPTGSVEFFVDGSPVAADERELSDGGASLMVGPFSTKGSHTVTAVYGGDANTSPRSETSTVEVVDGTPPPPAPASTSVTASAQPMTYGTSGRVDVSVAPTTATGEVTVRKGDVVLGARTLTEGQAGVTIGGLALEPGTHALTVTYAGDANHQASSMPLSIEVGLATPVVTSTLSQDEVVVGSGTTTATVSVSAVGYQPTGPVKFFVDGVSAGEQLLSDGIASLEVGPFATGGSRTVTAVYAGDSHTVAESAESTVRVAKVDSSVSVSDRPNKVRAGKTEVLLIVRVEADGFTPDGVVRIKVQGQGTTSVALDNGKAKLRLDAFNWPGRKTVEVTYKGSDQVESSSVRHTIKVVNKKK